MDKKKVKELMEQIRRQLFLLGNHSNNDDRRVRIIRSCLDDIDNELSKSDWVSVDDDLPPYGERVDVCDKAKPQEVYQTRRVKAHDGLITDKNDFAIMCVNVTHWKPIEKLEE